MLARASQILSTHPSKPNNNNITFLKANITSIPLPPNTADCIISNCVINLVPAADKPAVFREMFRLLKPGGRVAVSDILARKPLPEQLRRDVALYVGCVAGASEVGEYEGWLGEVGFEGEFFFFFFFRWVLFRGEGGGGGGGEGLCAKRGG